MTHCFTRQELYDLVWAEPMKKLAPKLGFSDVAVAKACRRVDVPVPERGYWSKLDAGRAVIKRALPPRGLGMPDTVSIGENPYRSHADLVAELLNESTPSAPAFAEDISSVIERVQKMVCEVTVPRDLTRPHPLIARLLYADERWRERQAAASFHLRTDGPFFDSLPERRRLRIINGLFFASQRCGCRPWIRDRQARETGLQVGHQNVSFTLETASERRHFRSSAASLRTKKVRERLRLTIPVWDAESQTVQPGQTWEDSEEAPIERHLTEIVVALIVAGEAHYRRSAQLQHEWRVRRRAELEEEGRRHREEEERKERERLARLEQDRIERLLAEAANWRRAAELQDYVAAVREARPKATDAASIERREQWATWVLVQADRIDPLLGDGPTFDEMGNTG